MKTTKKLPVQLSDEELLDRSSALVESIQKTAALKEEKKAQDAEINGKIKLSAEVTRRLAGIIADKAEDREVECEIKKDSERGTVTTVRLDTGEVIETRPLTEEERQEEMRFQPRKDRAPVKGKGGKPFQDQDEATE